MVSRNWVRKLFARTPVTIRKSGRPTRLALEPLEDRTVPAILTESGTTLTINLNNTGEAFTLSSLTNSPAVVNAAYGLSSTASFDFTSITAGRIKTLGRSFAITRAGQAAYDTINIIDSAQDTRVVFTGLAGDPYTENVTVTLDDDTSISQVDLDKGSVGFAGGAGNLVLPFGSNNLTISTTRNFFAPARNTVSTTSGNISIRANEAGTTTGDIAAIVMAATAIESTGTGAITLVGHGGTGDTLQYGVRLTSTTKIKTTTGSVLIQGTGGGNGTRFNNDGVSLLDDVTVESTQGSVTISGQAGPSSGSSTGVNIDKRSEIRSSGGAITVTGTGGTGGTGQRLTGVSITNGSLIKATDSNITVTGQGGGTGTASNSFGVRVDLSSIDTSNAGTITINGTGGGGTGNGNFGVYLSNFGPSDSVITDSGAITINGTAGTGPSNLQQIGIKLDQGSIRTNGGPILINGKKPSVGIGGDVGVLGTKITSSGGDITITSDTDIYGSGAITTGAGGGNITLIADQDGTGTPNNAGTIDAYAGDLTAGTGTIRLSLTDTDGVLSGNIVSAGSVVKEGNGTLQLNGTNNAYTGSTTVNAGALYVNGAVTATSGTAVNSGGTLGGTGSIANTVTVNSGGTITGGTLTDEGTLTVGGLSFNGGTYHADLQGTTSDTIATTGAVDLNAGAAGIFDLNVLGGTGAGGVYTFIDNQGAAAIADPPLTNATEGGTVTINGQTGTYTYLGGTGNDFTLSLPVGPTVTYTGTSADENFRLVRTATNLELYSVASITVTPTGAITFTSPTLLQSWLAAGVQQVIIDGNGGSDNLMIDYAGVAGLDDVNVVFEGGGAGTNSGLFVNGGTFGRVEYDYVDPNDGVIGNFADAAGANLRSLIFYSGLAPITNNSVVTDVVFDLPASGNVQTILEDDGTTGNTLSRFRSSPTAFEQTDFRNPTGSLIINRGSATDDLTVNALPDFNAGLTIGDSLAPLDQLTFAGAVILGSGNSLTADATEINFITASSDVALSGTGAAALTTAKNITFLAGSSLTTVDGDITLSANAAGTSTGTFTGIEVADGTVQSSGSGAVSLSGRGGVGSSDLGVRVSTGGKVLGGSGDVTVQGTGGGGGGPAGVIVAGANSQIGSTGGNVTVTGQGGSSSGTNGNGVVVSTGGSITAGGTGAVSVAGTGGSGTGNSQIGVLVVGANTQITSSGGDVTVIGQGGGTGASANDYGIRILSGGVITAGGTGNVNVFGLGGNGTGSGQAGVVVNGTGSQITSSGGDVSVLALGGLSGDQAYGVWVDNGSFITAGGAGSVNVSGIGGGSGTDNTGVLISGTGSKIATGAGGGDVAITGEAGVGTDQAGVALRSGGSVTTTTGDLQIIGSGGSSGDVQLNGPVSSSGGAIGILVEHDIVGDASGTISSGGGDISLGADSDGSGTPNDAGTIQLASDLAAGTGTITLALTDTDGFLNGNIVSAGKVVKDGTGTLKLNGVANAYTGATTVSGGVLLVEGAVTGTGAVDVDLGATLGGTGSLAGVVTVNTGGTITGGTLSDTGTLTVGGLSFDGGTYHADLQGTDSDTIATAGAVNLANPTQGIFDLHILGGGTSKGGIYTLIDNQGAGAITNPPFVNAAEGGTVPVNGQTGTYTYLGGTGNDFTLTLTPDTFVLYTGTPANENYRLVLNGANIELYSVATIVVGPTGAITFTSPTLLQSWAAAGIGLILIDGGGGSDNLMIDYTGTAGLENIDISFAGGGAATNSGLFVNGGTFGKVEYAPIDANNGFIGNFDATGASLDSIIFYAGLAPITNNSTATDVVFDLPASGNIQAILEDDGTTGNTLTRMRSNPTAFEQTDFRNPTGSLIINRGSVTDDLTINAVPDFAATLNIGDSLDRFDKLTVAGAATLGSNDNLTAFASAINFSTTNADVALSGSGKAILDATRSVVLSAGSSLTTVNGDITLSGNAAGTAAGNFDGVQVAGSTVQSTGSGDVTLTGVAGSGFTDGTGVEVSVGKVASGTGTVTITGTGGSGSGANEIGVSVSGGSQITSGGDVTVNGTGGAGSGNGNIGVQVTGTGSKIETTGSSVSVTGQGGGTGASTSNIGVLVDAGGAIVSTKAGPVDVEGTGGATTGNSNAGVVVRVGSSITGGGDVVVGGQGGGTVTAGGGVGVLVTTTGGTATAISGTGTGIVQVLGFGGDGSGAGNSGVVVDGTGVSIGAGSSGLLNVGGFAGEGTGQVAVAVRNAAALTTTGADIEVDGLDSFSGIGGDILLNGPVSSAGGSLSVFAAHDITGDATGTLTSGGGDMNIVADADGAGTAGNAGTIQLQGDITAGKGLVSLSLPDADGALNGNIVSAGGVVKGGPGTLTLNGTANAYTGATTIDAGTLLVDGAVTGAGPVTVNSGGTLGGTGSLAGVVSVAGTITGGTVSTVGTLTVGGLSFDGGTYHADIQGDASDTIATTGPIDLAAPSQGTFTRHVLGGPTTQGTVFTLIDNQGVGAIANPPLTNAAEGGTTTVNGLIGTYSYLGGTGNDFTLSVTTPARPQTFAVGGAFGTVRLYVADGTPLSTLTPISGYTGLVSVALGDFDGDGTPDLAVAAASPLGVAGSTKATAGKVFLYDGVDAAAGKLTLIHTFTPFPTHSGPDGNTGAYTNGLNIATGDINGDGNLDLIAGTRGQEGGPNGQPIGKAEFGRLAVVNMGAATDGSQDTLIGSIITPFGTGYQKGVVVAAGNLDGTVGDELGVTRGGPVAKSLPAQVQPIKLKAFRFTGSALQEIDLSGAGLNPDGSSVTPLAPFLGLPGGTILRDGRVTFTDQNGDGKAELVFAAIDPFTTPGSNMVRVAAFSVAGTGPATAISTGTGPSNSYTHGSGLSVSYDITDVAANGGVENLAIVTTPNGSTAGTVAYLDPLSGAALPGGFSLSVAIGGVTFDGN